MKKIIIGGLFLAIVGIVMIGCEKEIENTVDKPINNMQTDDKLCDECVVAIIDGIFGVFEDAKFHRATTFRKRDGKNCGCEQCFGICWDNAINDNNFDLALDGEGVDIAFSKAVDGFSTLYFIGELPSNFEAEFGIDNEISVIRNNVKLMTFKTGVYTAHQEIGTIIYNNQELTYYGYVTVAVK